MCSGYLNIFQLYPPDCYEGGGARGKLCAQPSPLYSTVYCTVQCILAQLLSFTVTPTIPVPTFIIGQV